MERNIGKWEQANLFMNDPILSRCFPTTKQYSNADLLELLSEFKAVFIKPDSGGQGRGIIRVSKVAQGGIYITGYSLQGKTVNEIIGKIEDLHSIIQPYSKFQRILPYVIQEGIQSITPIGQSSGIRVHVQLVNGKWVVGGMLGKLIDSNDGIVNRHRGAKAVSISDLLENYMKLDHTIARRTAEYAAFICLQAAEVFGKEYPWCTDCGIDLGIDTSGKLWIFELNTTPSVAFFYQLEDKSIWRQIINNRKTRNQ